MKNDPFYDPKWFKSAPTGWSGRKELAPLAYLVERASGTLEKADPNLRQAYLGTLSRNTRIFARVKEVLDAADAAHVTLLPFKGILLAHEYPDIGARPMVDIDLLVQPNDLSAACAVIEASGFERLFQNQRRFTAAHGHDIAFDDRHDPSLVLELHYRLFHELRGDASVEEIFRRKQEISILDKRRFVPDWSDQLWLVAVHAAAHAFWDHPYWPIDLLLLVHKRQADLVWAEGEATRRKYGRAFHQAMRIGHDILPEWIADQSGAERDARRSRLIDRLLGPVPFHAPLIGAKSLAVRSLLTESVSDAARELGRKTGLRILEIFKR